MHGKIVSEFKCSKILNDFYMKDNFNSSLQLVRLIIFNSEKTAQNSAGKNLWHNVFLACEFLGKYLLLRNTQP